MWEYETEDFFRLPTLSDLWVREGWELVTVVPLKSNGLRSYRVYYKRKVE